jgi:hypothetical protein
MDTTKLWTETINRFAEVNNQCLALKIYGTHNPSCSAYRLQFYGLLRRKFKSTNRHFKGWCIVTDAIATLARCVSRQRWNPSSLFYHASGPIRFVLRLSQTLRCPCLVLCVSMGHNTSIHTFGVLSSNLQTVHANATGRSRLYHGSFLAPDVSHSIMVFHTRLMFFSCLSTPSLLIFPPICQLFDCVAEKCSNYGSFMLLRQCRWSGIYKTWQTTGIHDWRLLKLHYLSSFVT